MSNLIRRACQRFPIESSAELDTPKAKGIVTILTDVSAGGAGVVANVPLETMEKVEVLIKSCFLFESCLRKKARVVWCRDLGTGLWQAGLDFGIDKLTAFA
ncbi:MAG: PilZ domain-containing protein [Candidatus Omnitrophica bacterium]|nr:PilZ domain-containing protein [Candidatus Omnitrophota bacterium]